MILFSSSYGSGFLKCAIVFSLLFALTLIISVIGDGIQHTHYCNIDDGDFNMCAFNGVIGIFYICTCAFSFMIPLVIMEKMLKYYDVISQDINYTSKQITFIILINMAGTVCWIFLSPVVATFWHVKDICINISDTIDFFVCGLMGNIFMFLIVTLGLLIITGILIAYFKYINSKNETVPLKNLEESFSL